MSMEVYDIGQVHIITSDDDLDILLGTEEALTEEDADWLRWLAMDDGSDDDYMPDEHDDYDSAIEDDYTWIRGGC